jgi:hypothetical protein
MRELFDVSGTTRVADVQRDRPVQRQSVLHSQLAFPYWVDWPEAIGVDPKRDEPRADSDPCDCIEEWRARAEHKVGGEAPEQSPGCPDASWLKR